MATCEYNDTCPRVYWILTLYRVPQFSPVVSIKLIYDLSSTLMFLINLGCIPDDAISPWFQNVCLKHHGYSFIKAGPTTAGDTCRGEDIVFLCRNSKNKRPMSTMYKHCTSVEEFQSLTTVVVIGSLLGRAVGTFGYSG